MNLVLSYADVLKHAAAAESLTALAIRDSLRSSTFASSPVGAFADILYDLDQATDEYRCAGRVLDPYTAVSDSNVRAFAVETRDLFDRHAVWVIALKEELKRNVGPHPRTLLQQSEAIAALHRRRDTLTKLLAINSIGLTYLLVDTSMERSTRLLLTSAERDSVLIALNIVASGTTSDAPLAARTVAEWMTEGWTTP